MTSQRDTDWRAIVRAHLQGLNLDPSDLDDLVEELAEHLESEAMDMRSRGISAAQARDALESQLLDIEQFATKRRRFTRGISPLAVEEGSARTQETANSRVFNSTSEFLRDLRYGIRSLSRERAFSAFVVATLALGIGADAGMFGILDRLLLRGPLHVQDADQLRRVISTTHPPGQPPLRTGYLGYVQYEAFPADTQTFAGVAAYNFIPKAAQFGHGLDARPVNSGTATASFFPLLGVKPTLGRFFDEREDDPDSPQNVVVLGHGLWQTTFGGSADIVGKTAHVDFRPHTVIGVAPEGSGSGSG